MGRSFLQFQGDTFLPPLQQPEAQPPYFLNLSEPNSRFQHTITTVRSDNFSLNDKTLKVSPSILLIIIILAIVFFISGLLHLLVRFLWRPQTREADDLDSVTALQGQLQQLFHLHDSGVDQSFIDTLPVFLYKAIIGLKNPFDCAVCLCEFEPDDKLRLLPKCSHAFHMECIDTWLLSHSTCPLCRATLLPDFSSNSNHTACSRSPIVLVLESGSDSSREIVEASSVVGRSSSSVRSMNVNMNTNSHLCGESEFGSTSVDENENPDESVEREKVVTVKLGKFRNVDLIDVGGGDGEGSSSTNNVDARRCFSMGSFAYVMDETSSLQVPIRTPMKQQTSKKKSVFLPLTPGQRPAMSECGCESRRDFRFSSFEDLNGAIGTTSNGNGAAIGRNRKESFSISKIWLRGKKDKSNSNVADSSRRAVSFRFPLQSNVSVAGSANTNDDLKGKSGKFDTRSSLSEMDIVKWGSEFGYDEENQSCYSMDSSQARAPSFARRTLLWLTGRQNKVVHSSSASTLSFFGNNFL